ncbi:MAG TPA: hypothetical protein VGK59_13715 [Ohtaekwangia sp.]
MIKVRANTIDERELVEKCMNELCRKLNFAGTQNLLQRDVEFLCDSIESKTGVQISLSTMKRLLNGQFAKLPQVATLNAITTFLDYQHWQDFKVKHSSSLTNGIPSPEVVAAPAAEVRVSKFFRKQNLIWTGVVLLVASGVWLTLNSFNKKTPGNSDQAQFSVHKATHNEMPNTVVFNYNVDNVDADSFFIQQSWDRNRRVRVYKNNYTLTDIYYEPGYHTAKLYANDEVIKTEDVSIPTDRWFLYAKDNMFAKPEYIKACCLVKNGLFGLELEDFVDNQVDITKEKEYIYTYFPSKIEVSSDNYILKARVRMREVRNNQCPHIMFEVFTQKYFMFFRTTTKGCSAESFLQFGENFIGGQNTDLTPLGYDVREWKDVEVVVKDKKVTISLNGNIAFSTAYENSAGLLTGLGFISNGLIEIDHVELKGLDGKVVYTNDFSKENTNQ